MKILVMGAGAVGIYFGARLAAAGEDVVFCARGANLEAMRSHGIDIISIRGDLQLANVTTCADPHDHAPYDLILFCVKAYDTERAAKAIVGCVAPTGAVMTLQNGVENEDRLAEFVPRKSIMGGNARVGVEVTAAGRVTHLSSGHIDFGELDGAHSDRARRFADAFKRAGIMGEMSDRFRTLRWDKLVWNGAFNTVATLTRRRVGEIIDDPEGLALVTRLMHEIVSVARADGAQIGYERVDSYLDHSRRNLRAIKTSTQQDLERGKPLEVEALSGAIVRAARRHDVAAPTAETIYALMRLLAGASAAR